ncbi:hypothetical protein PVAND_005205 [Polypedilum vanderplanki]|uniref:Cell division cycle protein 123 homolog n=1 Tax=Polypedilum vanderplanki TaxID=319348 RepID=A0A9J6C0C6_POLVA|nr:hypothetical protein PVAND_005205 [Polypedilum vanderplanki]
MLIQQKEISELISCSYHKIYEQFKKNCIKTYYLSIPTDVLNYLKQDLFILPKECNLHTGLSSQTENTKFIGEASNFSDEEDDDDENVVPEFPEFSKQILEILDKLGGSAFIKTNWHSPKDAFWITAGQTLKARDLSDVYQLLKASSICKEDLNIVNVENFHQIVFKKWKEIHPGTEFRCFVRNKNLIAISPRDWPQYHEHFKTQKNDIIKDIVSLFKEKIKNNFSIDSYCFDVLRETKDHVVIIDFSPFNEKFTAPLAFDWSYLHGDDIILSQNNDEEDDNPEFRYLANNDVGIQPNPRNNYGFPLDMINWFKNNSNANEQIQNLSELSIQQQADDDDEQ